MLIYPNEIFVFSPFDLSVKNHDDKIIFENLQYKFGLPSRISSVNDLTVESEV